MKDKMGDEARLRHILDAILEIQSYIKNTGLKNFAKDSMKKYATIKQLEIIGEAANHISDTIKGQYSEIKWREIIGLRNILIHQYFGVDENIIWDIITNDIPDLEKQCKRILKELD